MQKPGFLFCLKVIGKSVVLFFRRAQATRANVFVRNFAVDFGRYFMDIGVETAFCLFVRVADVIAGHFTFTANRTYFAHVLDLLMRAEQFSILIYHFFSPLATENGRFLLKF